MLLSLKDIKVFDEKPQVRFIYIKNSLKIWQSSTPASGVEKVSKTAKTTFEIPFDNYAATVFYEFLQQKKYLNLHYTSR